jgi:hypothetical protein
MDYSNQKNTGIAGLPVTPPNRGIMDIMSDAVARLNGNPTTDEYQKIQANKAIQQKQAELYQRQKDALPYHMRHYDPNTIPKQYWLGEKDPENTDKIRVPMFRAGTKELDTDPKTGLETISMRGSPEGQGKYGSDEMSGQWKQVNKQTNPYLPISNAYALLRDMKATEQLGVAQLPPETIAGLILQEGGASLGSQGYDKTQPKQAKLYSKLIEAGIPDTTASTLTQITYKQDLANRLKIPFGAAWNGTGKNWAGQSGVDYAKNLERQIVAAKHDKNKELMGLLNLALEHGAKYPYKIK